MNYPYISPANIQSQPAQHLYQQPLFPQPQGNVYLISNSLEVANVPMSNGISAALCLNEGIMYLKTMQNGNPSFVAYSVLPYEDKKESEVINTPDPYIELDKRVSKIEEAIASKKSKGGQVNDLF